MEAFEALCELTLRHTGYWVIPGVYVELSQKVKDDLDKEVAEPALNKKIFRSFPRTQLDLVAYKPAKNELLIIECKSYLDSAGVSSETFKFQNPQTDSRKFKEYKLFQHPAYFKAVSEKLIEDLKHKGMLENRKTPEIKLTLISGKIKDKNSIKIRELFRENGWKFISPRLIIRGLTRLKDLGYHNDPIVMIAKLLLR